MYECVYIYIHFLFIYIYINTRPVYYDIYIYISAKKMLDTRCCAAHATHSGIAVPHDPSYLRMQGSGFRVRGPRCRVEGSRALVPGGVEG